MLTIASQRCFNHSLREAVARCPQCRRYFCRECVTDYDERVVCSTCLTQIARPELTPRRPLGSCAGLLQCIVGILMVWVFFYFLGRALLSLPTSFHEGTVWQFNGDPGK